MVRLKTHQIEQAVAQERLVRGDDIVLRNTHFATDGEADVLGIRSSGYIAEYEVKVTRADYLRDSKKERWVKWRNRIEKTGCPVRKQVFGKDRYTDPPQYTYSGSPNYFFYVAPKGLLQASEIPDHAGFIEAEPNDNLYSSNVKLTLVKAAPLIHKYKLITEARWYSLALRCSTKHREALQSKEYFEDKCREHEVELGRLRKQVDYLKQQLQQRL